VYKNYFSRVHFVSVMLYIYVCVCAINARFMDHLMLKKERYIVPATEPPIFGHYT